MTFLCSEEMGSLPVRSESARSDEALVDITPSPPRPRFQAGGERVVGFLVVGFGVMVRRIIGTGHPAAAQAGQEGSQRIRVSLAVQAVI
jgi:hypothetical protein